MITYELAKQLKDKGFPQNHNWVEGKETIHCTKCASNKTLLDYEACRPTLSELIEACGETETLFMLEYLMACFTPHKNEDLTWGWIASTKKAKGFGETPKQAVARLWLVLNDK